MNKRFISIFLISITLLGLLSGCGKKVDYDASNLEKNLGEALEYTKNMKDKMDQAKTGKIYEDVEGTKVLGEEDENILVVNTQLPTMIKDDLKIPKSAVENKTEEKVFLDNLYQITAYRSMSLDYGAWDFKKTFTGNEDDVWNDIFTYMNKIENNYKDSIYFSTKYSRTKLSDLEDARYYIALYKIEDGQFYVMSKITHKGIIDDNGNVTVEHDLWFFNTQAEHDYSGEYADALDVFDDMIDEINIPSDFNLKIRYWDYGHTKKIYSEELTRDYGYGKETSPSYDGPTPPPAPIPEPAPTPTPTPTPEPSTEPESEEDLLEPPEGSEMPIDVPTESPVDTIPVPTTEPPQDNSDAPTAIPESEGPQETQTVIDEDLFRID